MANFVQVRFKTSNSSGRTVNHDFRLSKVSYLRDEQTHNNWENNFFDYKPNFVKQQIKESLNDYKQKYKERNNRNFRSDKNSDLLTGVITLSPSLNDMIKNGEVTKKQLDKMFQKSFDNVIEVMKKSNPDLKVHYAVIHYDEKTPHMHFATNNHLETGTSFYQHFKTQTQEDLYPEHPHFLYNITESEENPIQSYCQTVCAEPFNSIGFVRGIKKSKARHKEVREMHEEEIRILKKTKTSLSKSVSKLLINVGEDENTIRALQKQKEELLAILEVQKSILAQEREKVKEIKSQIKKFEITAQEKKQLLDIEDKKLKTIRADIATAKDLSRELVENLDTSVSNIQEDRILAFIKKSKQQQTTEDTEQKQPQENTSYFQKLV